MNLLVEIIHHIHERRPEFGPDDGLEIYQFVCDPQDEQMVDLVHKAHNLNLNFEAACEEWLVSHPDHEEIDWADPWWIGKINATVTPCKHSVDSGAAGVLSVIKGLST